MRFPPGNAADWDLTNANNLYFSVYAVNANQWFFQNNSPWVRLYDAEGGYFEYRHYQNGVQSDPLNTALNQWRDFVVPLRTSDLVANGWRRTIVGAPRLDHIGSIEFHADTWGAGFELWYDRVGFDLPVTIIAADFQSAGVPQLMLHFDQTVAATLDAADLDLRNLTTGGTIAPAAMSVAYDSATDVATITFPGLPGGRLSGGDYHLTIAATAVADPAGNTLAGPFVYDFTVPSDTDGDGLPDDWEIENGLDPANPADALEDLDGDGQSNLEEYAAGTDPRDPSDVFRVLHADRRAASFELTVPGRAGRTYTLLRSADLQAPGSWATITVFPAAAADSDLTLSDPNPPPVRAFYRVKVEKP